MRLNRLLTHSLLLLTPFAPELLAQNTIKAVIGLNSSQVVETLGQNSALSFNPVEGSIIPLINRQPIEIGRIYDQGKNWQRHINQTIKVSNRNNQQVYKGKLLSSNHEIFEILVEDQRIQLYLSDYNLTLPYVAKDSTPVFSKEDQLAYQTYDVLWQPQLSIFLDGKSATLRQNALIQNSSFSNITLNQPILQLKNHQNRPSPMEKMGRNVQFMSMASDEGAGVDYVQNEITVPTKQDIHLAPRQTLLFPLKEQTLPLKNARLVTEFYPNPRSRSEQIIQFEQQADLLLKQDAMPGSYQTFWQHNDYLLPAGTTQLTHVRKGNQVTLKINQSQDIKGGLTLLKADSMKLPSTQVWQLSLNNLSDKALNVDAFHNANGIIKRHQDKTEKQQTQLTLISASRLQLSYSLAPMEKVNIKYEVTISQ